MFDRRSASGLGLLHVVVIGAFILALPLVLITTTIRVAVSEQSVYDYSVKHYNAHEVSGIPEEELLRANGEIHRYLTGDYDGPLSITVTHKDGSSGPLFNARETAHMADVRDLVKATFAVQVAAVAAVLGLAVVMLMIWPPRALAAAALYGSLLTGAVLASAGVLVAMGFDAAWSQFHVIAFANDFWELDPDTDHLIQMFPEPFWERATVAVGGLILLEAALIAAIAAAYLYATRLRPAPESPVSEREPPVMPPPDLPGRAGHDRLSHRDLRRYLRG
jgi:integral membrane protein (TIGR01906 family)